ncbi:MAG: saccharopine dehydrogenase family protein [Thermoanaerobaculia bacterium]
MTAAEARASGCDASEGSDNTDGSAGSHISDRRLLFYGVTGYTGRLTLDRALARGLSPVLSGRSAGRLAPLAESLALEARAVRLDDSAGLDRTLADIDLVVHLAGPFSETAAPMAEACLRTGAHYLDIAGEYKVLDGLHRYESQARSRGVMILPGAAFAVAVSDALAVRVAGRLPGATRLRLGYSRFRFGSRGSYRTAIEMLDGSVPVRRDGRLEHIPAGRLEHRFDFGAGPTVCSAIAWGDVATAHRSTGIPNVETYLDTYPWERAGLLWTRALAGFHRPVRALAGLWAPLFPEGPSRSQRDSERKIVVAEAEAGGGRIARSRMVTPQVYDVTADATVLLASKVLESEFEPGVRTPAQVWGESLLSELAGVSVTDLD